MKNQVRLRDKITINQYFITFLMSSFNTISLFYFLFQIEEIKRFIFLTWWNFYITSIFFIAILICDTNLFIFKSKRFEHINYYFRNHFYPIILVYGIFICIIFWGVINPLSEYKQMGEDFYTIFRNCNVHGLIVIFLLIDMYFAERDKYSYNNNDVFMLFGIFTCYSILTIIMRKYFNIIVYNFLEKISFSLMLYVDLLFYLILFSFYYIYIIFMNWKLKNKIKVINLEKIEKIKA
jgi:hypothetical protein